MKERKKIILLAILLFIVGCGQRTAYIPDIHKGTEGLEIKFLENSPPNEVLYIKNNPVNFLIGIGLRNKGTEDINLGNIKITSFKNYIEILDGKDCRLIDGKCNLPRLKGKSIENIEGEFIPLYLNARVIKAESGIEESLEEIDIEACYPYKTTASSEICIDIAQQAYLKVKKTCEPKISSFTGQGAPIAVSSIKEDILPRDLDNQLRLEISFENKGKGRLVDKNCRRLNIANLEEISFSDYSLSNEKIKCDKDQIKIEKNKENKLVCYANLDKNLNPYLTILTIKLNYWYLTSAKKNIKIKNTDWKKEYESLITREGPVSFEKDINEECSTESPKYDNIIRKIAKRDNIKLDPCLIMAVIKRESNFKPDLISTKNAKGLMQLKEGTFESMGFNKEDIFDPEKNILAGSKYLRQQYDNFKNLNLALAAYNAGPGEVKKYNGVPPFEETQKYIAFVLEYWEKYRRGIYP